MVIPKPLLRTFAVTAVVIFVFISFPQLYFKLNSPEDLVNSLARSTLSGSIPNVNVNSKSKGSISNTTSTIKPSATIYDKSITKFINSDNSFSIWDYLQPHTKQQRLLDKYNQQVLLKGALTSTPESILGLPTIGITTSTPVNEFWNKIFTIFRDNKVKAAEGEDLIQYVHSDQKLSEMSDEEFNAYSKESLLGKANISDTNLKRIKVAHANILRQLPTQLDQSTYVKGSKGIVMLGGGFYSWLSFLSIMHLRDNGSKLPIELVLASWSDYDKEYHFCHQVLPKYNAKCILMPQVLGHHVISQIGIGSYQLKSIAIAVSSFEHVLMLDSDNVALVNPDTIFDSKVYKDHGLVLWPDYWQRSMSPLYYEIAQIPVNEQVRVRWGRFPLVKPILVEEDGTTINKEKKKQKLNFHEYAGSIPDLSSESGQLLINKGTHAKTLLLSLYYNLYGPDIYYRLFSLGELGEGDKDTFITAAFATQAKYYQVLSHIRTQGFSDENGYHGMAMGQKDPVVDYEVVTKQYAKIERELNRNKSADQFELIDKMQAEYFGGVSEIPLFTLHCNIAKVNPEEYTRNDAVSDLEENRIKARIYSNFKYKIVERDQDREIDFELKRWTIIQQAICIDNLEFYLFDEKDKKKTCDYINNTVRWLISTSDMVDGKSLTSLDRKKPHQPVYNYK